jgi:hypothetical protein
MSAPGSEPGTTWQTPRVPTTTRTEEGAGRITRVQSRVEEYAVRQLALQHAVTTHGATVDDDQVVKAAEAYLTFLTGGKPGEQ